MHRTDIYPQHGSIIWTVWLNGWVLVYELSGCGFESSCSHLSNSQFNKLKSEIKNDTEVTLNPSSTVIGDSNNENNFLHNLLTDGHVLRLCIAVANNSSAKIKLSECPPSKIVHLGGFFEPSKAVMGRTSGMAGIVSLIGKVSKNLNHAKSNKEVWRLISDALCNFLNKKFFSAIGSGLALAKKDKRY